MFVLKGVTKWLALALIVGDMSWLISGENLSEQNVSTEVSQASSALTNTYNEKEQRTKQDEADFSSAGERDNMRHYISKSVFHRSAKKVPEHLDLNLTQNPLSFLSTSTACHQKGLDLDGYTLKQPAEQWRMVKLNQLLDALIPYQIGSSLHRNGRTLPSLSIYGPIESRQASLRVVPATKVGSAKPELVDELDTELQAQTDGRASRGRKHSLLGIVWTPTRSTQQTSTPGLLSRGRQSQILMTSKAAIPHRSVESQEVALHAPMHSRSVSDYEWKRVENSRWNNLRGMWGKRSDEQQEEKLPIGIADDSLLPSADQVGSM